MQGVGLEADIDQVVTNVQRVQENQQHMKRKNGLLCTLLTVFVTLKVIRQFLKVAPYSFFTACELVSKSRDGASFKKIYA